MQFLKKKSIQLLDTLYPDLFSITDQKFVNFLSCYVSFMGRHFYYSPTLLSNQCLKQYFSNKQMKLNELSMKIESKNLNTEHLLAKHLLMTNFQSHLIHYRDCERIFNEFNHLKQIRYFDIVQEFLKNECSVDRQFSIKINGKLLNEKQKRTFYIFSKKQIPSIQELELFILKNRLLQIPNLNKILIFIKPNHLYPNLPTILEEFCLAHSIKIKLLQDDKVQTLLQYLYKQTTNKNTLFHECVFEGPEMYKIITPLNQRRNLNGNVTNYLKLRLMPKQALIFGQRLPQQSLATEKNESQILQKIEKLGNFDQYWGQKRYQFNVQSVLENYTNRYHLDKFKSSPAGFCIKRFVPMEFKAKNKDLIHYEQFGVAASKKFNRN